MRRIVLLPAVLSLALVPAAADAQFASGGFVMGGQGGGGTALMQPRFNVDLGYVVEISEGDGPYFGARYTLGIHRFRADQQGLRDRYGDGGGTVEGGGGTLYDTGGDVEVGFGVSVLRVYGFTGIHYYQQYHYPATVRSGGDEVEVAIRRRESISNGRGVGVHLRLTDTGAAVAEWYRGGGQDGVMRLSGTRFGLRWAW
jgi:hypothetical protein